MLQVTVEGLASMPPIDHVPWLWGQRANIPLAVWLSKHSCYMGVFQSLLGPSEHLPNSRMGRRINVALKMDQKDLAYPLLVGGQTLLKVGEFKDLRVLLITEVRIEQIRVASGFMEFLLINLHHTDVKALLGTRVKVHML